MMIYVIEGVLHRAQTRSPQSEHRSIISHNSVEDLEIYESVKTRVA